MEHNIGNPSWIKGPEHQMEIASLFYLAAKRPKYVTGYSQLEAVYRLMWMDQVQNTGCKDMLGKICLLVLLLLLPKKDNIGLTDSKTLLSFQVQNELPLLCWIVKNITVNNPESLLQWALAIKIHQSIGLLGSIIAETYDENAIREEVGRIYALGYDWTIFETRDGYLALCPRYTLPGDILCIVHGCNNPIVLRKSGNHFVHIGASFVPGLMAGESAVLFDKNTTHGQEFQTQ